MFYVVFVFCRCLCSFAVYRAAVIFLCYIPRKSQSIFVCCRQINNGDELVIVMWKKTISDWSIDKYIGSRIRLLSIWSTGLLIKVIGSLTAQARAEFDLPLVVFDNFSVRVRTYFWMVTLWNEANLMSFEFQRRSCFRRVRAACQNDFMHHSGVRSPDLRGMWEF